MLAQVVRSRVSAANKQSKPAFEWETGPALLENEPSNLFMMVKQCRGPYSRFDFGCSCGEAGMDQALQH